MITTSPKCDHCKKVGVPDLWPIEPWRQKVYDLQHVNYFRRLCTACREQFPEFSCLPPKDESSARSTPA